jgi:hypothetical protein
VVEKSGQIPKIKDHISVSLSICSYHLSVKGLMAAEISRHTSYQFSALTLTNSFYFSIRLAERTQGRISPVQYGWDACPKAICYNQSNGYSD